MEYGCHSHVLSLEQISGYYSLSAAGMASRLVDNNLNSFFQSSLTTNDQGALQDMILDFFEDEKTTGN